MYRLMVEGSGETVCRSEESFKLQTMLLRARRATFYIWFDAVPGISMAGWQIATY